MKNNKTRKLVLSALFLALCIVLPFLTGQLKELGSALLPMHLPVMLCGLLCGGGLGAAVGFLAPFLRSLIFGMPALYPNCVWMSCELATYGFVIGILYNKLFKKQLVWLYCSLVLAMLSGRVVWGVVKAAVLGLGGSGFTVSAFIAGGFTSAFPGIILQLLLIPLIISLINRKSKSDVL